MLTQLTLRHFTIVEQLVLDYHSGFTAITGETGAGKSISLDAIHLCLGARAESHWVKSGEKRAEITAHFTLEDTPSAKEWLKYEQLDDDNECLIRRVINADGKSKAFVNGQAVTLAQLKCLGQYLIQIHGQHDYQRLLDNQSQQHLVDHSLNKPHLMSALRLAFKKWKNAQKQLQQKYKEKQENEAKIQLLEYQMTELEEFAPIQGEFEKIEEEYSRLSNGEQLIQQSENLIDLVSENESYNLLKECHRATQIAQQMAQMDSACQEPLSLFEQAKIQLEEAYYHLKNYVTSLDLDGEKMTQLNQRLSKQITLARKHQVKPQDLPALHCQIKQELGSILHHDEEIAQLEKGIALLQAETLNLAHEVHTQRLQEAALMSIDITQKIKALAMPHAEFKIDIHWNEALLSETGADQVIFMVSTNLGQPLQPMAKIASGGELSRIALAIQVLIAKKLEMPALIFDEIDTGISGMTAAKVGHLLKQLGESTQVITITHLPQVAGYADHHLFVNKTTQSSGTQTHISPLYEEDRIKELARLLSGDKVTQATLANARELLIA